jgi:hypothetical protein
MNTQCCDPFAAMEPARQAEYLTLLAQEARLLEFALQGDGIEARNAASELQRALEQAMDADECDSGIACTGLACALGDVYGAGLRLTARLNEVAVDGILGKMKFSVLTAVLAPAA